MTATPGVTPQRPGTRRLRVNVRGVVQGVGFRPFIHRLAMEHGLVGWVHNASDGVSIEVEGDCGQLSSFLNRVEQEAPAQSSVEALEARWLDPAGFRQFEIRESTAAGTPAMVVPPDAAICAECLGEVLDPTNRRHRHPFTHCTQCGPRFSILEDVPYDRVRTSMRVFPMCAECRAEYEDPGDRRFHAQTNACWSCGPQLALWDRSGAVLQAGDAALRAAAAAICAGQIVAVKGLGGFHLLVAAENPAAVARLRRLKCREEKPFALMMSGVEAARTWCVVGPIEERLLCSPEAPIVLLRRLGPRAGSSPASLLVGVAPGNPWLGVMLPPTAMHHLLLREVGGPVVATSGNLRDEPLCRDEREALERLGGIADLLLVHDRPIVRRLDDSVVRVVLGRELVLRRARGFAPLPIAAPARPAAGRSLLAAGGHLKNTVALSVGSQVFLSQHIGDLETVEALESHHHTRGDLERLHHVVADCVVVDGHAGYASSRAAASLGRPVIPVQHHFAHLLSCLAENGLVPPALGVIWDGTGAGPDGTIWGGEFLVARETGFTREGWLRTFPLPGGEAAIREPRRAALGLLHELLGDEVWERKDLVTIQAFTGAELRTLRGMLQRGVNAPRTSSVGRLFDAVASLAGVRQISRYEGQAAMELEFAAEAAEPGSPAGPGPTGTGCGLSWKPAVAPDPAGKPRPAWVADWGGMITALLEDVQAGAGAAAVAWRFHEALANCVLPLATRVGLEHVALSGGCFQNRLLTELTVSRLRAAGFRPAWHRRVPPNDGGLALGQVMAGLQAVP